MLLPALLLLIQDVPCAATDAALPAPLAGWTAPGERFGIGMAVTLDAADPAGIAGLPADARPGGAALLGFRTETAGTYGVALDQPGWIDVIPGAEGGAPLASVAHGRGPECSTIRKIVRFRLEPGVHRLALTGLSRPQARVMLVAGD